MFELRTGNLFESNADALVNPVNCVGAMGKGIALEFRIRYPAMFREYRKVCANRLVRPGRVWIWRGGRETPAIICFPTKDDWRGASKMEWILDGLDDLRHRLQEDPFRVDEPRCRMTQEPLGSLALPAIGCGEGGLPFELVRAAVENRLGRLPLHVAMYEPV